MRARARLSVFAVVVAAILVCAGSGEAVRLDNTVPVVTQPPDISVTASSLCNGIGCAFVTYSLSATGGTPPYHFLCNLPSGTFFLVGSSRVTCSVQDAGGDQSVEVSFTVTVSPPPGADTTPPTFHNVPSSFSVSAQEAGGASVPYAVPTATDAVDGAVSVSCNPGPGNFPIGSTTVTCTASDSHGNTATASFTVTVVDGPVTTTTTTTTATTTTTTTPTTTTTAPVTTTTASITTTTASTPPTTTAATTTTTAAPTTTAATPSAPKPKSPVTTTAATTTAAAPTAKDTTAPVLAAHRNLIVDATAPGGAIVAYTVRATDPDDTHVAVACSPRSGSRFPMAARGRTRITVVSCGARDAAGNTAARVSFTVTVRGVHDQLVDLERTLRSAHGLSKRERGALVAPLVRADRDYAARSLPAAAAQLRLFTRQVLALPPSLRNAPTAWLAAAARVRAVL